MYWVSDGIDCCRVGFLHQHLVKHSKHYDGALAQITEMYCKDSESPSKRKKHVRNKDCCLAAVISALYKEDLKVGFWRVLLPNSTMLEKGLICYPIKSY